MIKLLLIILLSSTYVLTSPSPSTNFGLKTTGGKALELLELTTKAIVEGPYAEIQYIQTYKNPLADTVETKFHFPRTESSIFHKFEAVFQNQTIVGKILEKQTAKKMYDWNKKRGNTVAYSERNHIAPDIMNIKVGNIPAYETVQIIFSVIQPLEIIMSKFYELKLPVVLTERYSPASANQNEVPNIKTVDTKGSLYKEWNIQVELKSNTPFAILTNPTHRLKPELSEKPPGLTSKIYKAFWNVTVIPNKDFVVNFGPEKMEKLEPILATHPQDPNDHVLLVNFIPDLTAVEPKFIQNLLETAEDSLMKIQKLAYDYDVENAQAEFVFVIDRSGSMQGARILNLRKALAKFLSVLPKKSYFNIISFGDTCQLYKSQSIINSPQALRKALRWVETIQADMGGTEILEPLRYLTRPENHIHDFPRIVMILTDGDVFNPDQVINHISSNANKMRFCSVGIGYGASEYLVKNMAEAGKCQSQFVLDHEDIGDKAMYLVKAAISQYATDITFDLKCFNDQSQIVKQERAQMDMLLKGQTWKKWVYLNNVTNIQACYIDFSYFSSIKGKRVTEQMDLYDYKIEEISDVWHKVAYDAKVRELEQKIKQGDWDHANLKDNIINLSTKYQILSDYTSFLAVLQESTVDPNEVKTEINIPNMKSADYSNQEHQQDQDQNDTDSDDEEYYADFNADLSDSDAEAILMNVNTNVEVSNLIEFNTDDFYGDCSCTNLDLDLDDDLSSLDLSSEINTSHDNRFKVNTHKGKKKLRVDQAETEEINQLNRDSPSSDLHEMKSEINIPADSSSQEQKEADSNQGDVNPECLEGLLVETCQETNVKEKPKVNEREEVQEAAKRETEEISHLKPKQDPQNLAQPLHSSNSTKTLISDEKVSEKQEESLARTPGSLSDNSNLKITGISLIVSLLFALLF